MDRLLLLLAFSLVVPTALAQHSIEAFPNPYDGAVHDTLVLRNTGTEPVTLDSLRFASSLSYDIDGPGWYLRYVASLDEREIRGDITCEPYPDYQCEDQMGLFGSTLAPGDSVALVSLQGYCAICRSGFNQGHITDTLLVYGGDAAEPLEIRIVNGKMMVSTEGGPSATYRLEVFPNPTRGRLTVRLDLPAASEVEIRVYDGLGRRVAGPERQIAGVGEHLVRLSLGHLPAGIYHLEVRSGTGGRDRSHRTVILLD